MSDDVNNWTKQQILANPKIIEQLISCHTFKEYAKEKNDDGTFDDIPKLTLLVEDVLEKSDEVLKYFRDLKDQLYNPELLAFVEEGIMKLTKVKTSMIAISEAIESGVINSGNNKFDL